MAVNNRYSLVKENHACFKCLEMGHFIRDCDASSKCVEACNRNHHRSLHTSESNGNNTYVNNISADNDHQNLYSCLLQIMPIRVADKLNQYINVLWDSGSTISLIMKQRAFEYGLKCSPI